MHKPACKVLSRPKVAVDVDLVRCFILQVPRLFEPVDGKGADTALFSIQEDKIAYPMLERAKYRDASRPE